MNNLHEITLNQMKEATTGNTYNIVSEDTYSLSVAFYGAVVEVDPDYGGGGEIVIYKPGTLCEVKIDCEDILDEIVTDGEGYFLITFNNEMVGMEITKVSE